MQNNIKIGYFEHWFLPQYRFVDFLSELGVKAEKIDISSPGYLEGFDVALIEQNSFNDYIENDEQYIREWVSRGGIVFMMHQDYKRWAPYFLPSELGYLPLIHRYVETIGRCTPDESFTNDPTHYMAYMMPWIEDAGAALFSEPEKITPDEMLFWDIKVNSFGLVKKQREPDSVRTAALSTFVPNPAWEVLGSFMDPQVKDGALILRGNYGRGMYFLSEILFPETETSGNDRCISFWKKYAKNLLSYFERHVRGESYAVPSEKGSLPIKKNYKLAIHMHSLDWYGCDSAPGTINALMRYMNYDICSISIKDSAPYNGNLDAAKYSDDKVLFLDGQEYHPFNWRDKYAGKSHNTYHLLAIGTDPSAYTQKFTRSLYSDAEIDNYLKEAKAYATKNNGALCVTHPNFDYWIDYGFDAVDKEPMTPLSGSDIERAWLGGQRIALMNSVDLFGVRRMLDYPGVNIVYLMGETPSRDSVVKAIKLGHTIAATGFDEADITLGDRLPGDVLTKAECRELPLNISAKISRDNIRELRVYSGSELIYSESDINTPNLCRTLSLKDADLNGFIRVEIEGKTPRWICNSTPFYIQTKP